MNKKTVLTFAIFVLILITIEMSRKGYNPVGSLLPGEEEDLAGGILSGGNPDNATVIGTAPSYEGNAEYKYDYTGWKKFERSTFLGSGDRFRTNDSKVIFNLFSREISSLTVHEKTVIKFSRESIVGNGSFFMNEFSIENGTIELELPPYEVSEARVVTPSVMVDLPSKSDAKIHFKVSFNESSDKTFVQVFAGKVIIKRSNIERELLAGSTESF